MCLKYERPGFYPWVQKIPWRRTWQPTPVFLPRKCQRQRSLAGYSPWGSQRVRHNWVTSLSLSPPAVFWPGEFHGLYTPWGSRVGHDWLTSLSPTAVFWPGEFHGLYTPRGRKQSDMTERLSLNKKYFSYVNY